ncbi:hypothetical protein HZH66_010472 [Vespula vulgaris]|uniref:Uncharacterized protein n=1 Tax=Vespula vulgaris TaxID=7454 RepID=A0A834JJS1_VESVU|nr:hypothetical protein HZH66_010472 [Vespula vulgaris]
MNFNEFFGKEEEEEEEEEEKKQEEEEEEEEEEPYLQQTYKLSSQKISTSVLTRLRMTLANVTLRLDCLQLLAFRICTDHPSPFVLSHTSSRARKSNDTYLGTSIRELRDHQTGSLGICKI